MSEITVGYHLRRGAFEGIVLKIPYSTGIVRQSFPGLIHLATKYKALDTVYCICNLFICS